MVSSSKQIIVISLLLVVFLFFGLFVVSLNMERITLRDRHDFLSLDFPGEGVWRINFLGSSLTIDKMAISEKLHNTASYIGHYAARGYNYIEKVVEYVKDQVDKSKE